LVSSVTKINERPTKFAETLRERFFFASRKSRTWHGAFLLVVRLLIPDETVGAERVSTAQHLRVPITLEADHTLQ